MPPFSPLYSVHVQLLLEQKSVGDDVALFVALPSHYVCDDVAPSPPQYFVHGQHSPAHYSVDGAVPPVSPLYFVHGQLLLEQESVGNDVALPSH